MSGWRLKPTKQSNSRRAHSTDQVKGSDVDEYDGGGQWADSGIVGRGHRGKETDGEGSDGSRARLPGNQG